MERKFTLSCCPRWTCPIRTWRAGTSPCCFTPTVDGQTYDDDMGSRSGGAAPVLRLSEGGQAAPDQPDQCGGLYGLFESLLQKGGDVLHIAFTSGQSCSVNNAYLAAAELKDKYPGQKLIVIDSLCSSSGYGLLVDYAADMRDAGEDIDTVAQWVLDNRNKVHHQFFSSDMTQFRRTGRVSGAAATVATVLNICPIMRLDDKGRHQGIQQGAGQEKAVETTVDTMEQHAQGGRDYDGKCFICHSQCPEDRPAGHGPPWRIVFRS